MKNYLLGLLMLCLPLPVMAQPSQQPITEMLYQSASDIFPTICKKELPEAIDYVKQCYQHAGSDKAKLENCLITDYYVGKIIQWSAQRKAYSAQDMDSVEKIEKIQLQFRKQLTKMYPNNIIMYFYDLKNRLLSNFPIINKNKHYDFHTYVDLFDDFSEIFAKQIEKQYSKAKSKKEQCIENVFFKNNVLMY